MMLGGMSSCQSTKDISYFQDITTDGTSVAIEPKEIVVRPQDKISILVNSRDPLLSDMFNLPYISRQIGQAARGTTYGQPEGLSGYTVNAEGNIDFPILGQIHVAGLTRHQISEKIKKMLEADNLIKEPIVTVEFLNQGYSVLGEVNKPGRYAIDRDNLSLLDAISQAGDLTINGLRKSVKLIRTEGGTQKTYVIDMTSAESIRTSPAFYLQQDDIIYVEPNNQRKRQSTVNGNTALSMSFYVSVASLLCSVAVLIWK